MKKIMKKASAIIILVSLLLSNSAFAGNTASENIIINSISEEDGTIAIGCTVYNENGTIYGTLKDDGRYLENLIPMALLNTTEKMILSTEWQSKTITINGNNGIFKSGDITSNNFMINWENISKVKTDFIDVNIVKSETGEIVARGYKLNSEDKYLIINNMQNGPYRVEVINLPSDSIIELSLSNMDINLSNTHYMLSSGLDSRLLANIVTTRYTTSTVPKNIDGNQGQFLISHTVKGDSGHRVPHSKYVSGTNNMTSVNMAVYYAGINYGLAMNVTAGSEIGWNVSIGIGDSINVKMSTNSNSGIATVDMIDALY